MTLCCNSQSCTGGHFRYYSKWGVSCYL